MGSSASLCKAVGQKAQKIDETQMKRVQEGGECTSCSKPAAGAGGVDVVEDKCLGLDLNSKVCLV